MDAVFHWDKALTLLFLLTRIPCCTNILSMKNMTITLDENVALWARIRAAEQETSVSRLVGEMLKERMLEEENYRSAMRQYLSKPQVVIKEPGSTYPDRETLHDR